jgi:hypothetical protein
MTIYTSISEFFLELQLVQTKSVEKINTVFFLQNSFSENPAVYDMMWKNMVEPHMSEMIVRFMRFAYWATKVTTYTHTHTHTHTECIIDTSFPCQQWIKEQASVLGYNYTAFFVVCFRLSLTLLISLSHVCF